LGYFLRKFATFEMIWATNRKDFLATLNNVTKRRQCSK